MLGESDSEVMVGELQTTLCSGLQVGLVDHPVTDRKFCYLWEMAMSEKRRVVIVSFFASFIMTVTKFAAGIVSGSLGILSEAIHSLIDMGATAVTWFAVSYADQPPDEEHHYGHAKAESVAALVETGLLFLTTGWIVYEAVRRLLGEAHAVEVTWWAVSVVAGSIIIDFWRSRSLSRVAAQTSSEALEADALHFSSDMWSSFCVLGGLAGVWLGFPMADAFAALVVAVFVALAGWRLAQRTLNTLLDRAPDGATADIRAIIDQMPGVLNLTSLRIRPAGPTLFTSIVVEVPRTTPVDNIVKLKDSLAEKVRARFPNSDITVTANPVALDSESVFQRVMMIAARRSVAIHHLNIQQIGGRLAVSFDLEVEGSLPLAVAHEQATALENIIRNELGTDIEVESHIEPHPERLLPGEDAPAATARAITALLANLAKSQTKASDLHNIRIRRNDQGLYVHYHCRFEPGETVDAVHDAVDWIEDGLKAKFPEIRRVIAHTEPIGGERHPL
jgi:cation diffusion facilitator family transporter